MRETGTFAGRYSYDQIITGSKTGEALIAIDEETLAYVVIKRPDMQQPNADLLNASIADIAREERALATAGIHSHPAVCHLLDVGTAASNGREYRYIVIERARGETLADLAAGYQQQGQPVPEGLVYRLLAQLLDVLRVSHEHGVVYNDVKLDHLFWDETAQQLKVIDWGNARFMADDDAVRPSDDVFQVGELVFELLTERKYTPVPHHAWEAEGRPAFDVGRHAGVSEALRPLLSRALHPDPTQRYADAGDMLAALQPLLDESATYVRTHADQLAQLTGDPARVDEAEAVLAALLRHDPEHPQVRALASQLAATTARRGEAATRLALIEAVLAEDWAQVREHGERAGLPLWVAFARLMQQALRGMAPVGCAALSSKARDAALYYLQQPRALWSAEAVLRPAGDSLICMDNLLLAELARDAGVRWLVPALADLFRHAGNGFSRDDSEAVIAALAGRHAVATPAELSQAYDGVVQALSGCQAAVTAQDGFAAVLALVRDLRAMAVDADDALSRRDPTGYASALSRIAGHDPHNTSIMARLYGLPGPVMALAGAPARLDEPCAPAQFGAWLDSIAPVAAAAGSGPLQAAVPAMVQAWLQVEAAAERNDVAGLRSALADLRRSVTTSNALRLIAVVDGLQGLGRERPWLFSRDAAVAVLVDEGFAALARGEAGVVVAQFSGAGEAVAPWLVYLTALDQAQHALLQGDGARAGDALATVEGAPMREAHWQVLTEIRAVYDALRLGNTAKAQHVLDTLLAEHEVLAAHLPLASKAQARVAAQAGVVDALLRFVDRPETLVDEAASFADDFRVDAVRAAEGVSSRVRQALHDWRAGRFQQATTGLERALADAQRLPALHLGVPLTDCQRSIQQHLAQVQATTGQLNDVLAEVRSARTERRAVDDVLVLGHLTRLVEQMPDDGAHRPAAWRDAFRTLTGPKAAGMDAAAKAAVLPAHDVTEDELIYPLFDLLIHGRARTAQPVPARRTSPAARLAGDAPRAGLLSQPLVRVGLAVVAVLLLATVLGVVFTQLGGDDALPPVSDAATTVDAGTTVAAASEATATLPPTTDAPMPTIAPTVEPTLAAFCAQVSSLEAGDQWANLVDFVDANALVVAADATCDGRGLAAIQGQAWSVIGQAAYRDADYATAISALNTAISLGGVDMETVSILVRCAEARAAGGQAALQTVYDEYGEGLVNTVCGLAVAEDREALDLLARMATRNVDLVSDCPRSTCPALFESEQTPGLFLASTFFGNDRGALVFDERFQRRTTDTAWEGRVRQLAVTFEIASLSPNSFPYGRAFGIVVNRGIYLLATSQSPLSARVEVLRAPGGGALCAPPPDNVVALTNAIDEQQAATLAIDWSPETQAMQFYLNGVALCETPLSVPELLEVGVAIEGEGTSLRVVDLQVELAP